jgi:uncharacterized protein (DUF427 family)
MTPIDELPFKAEPSARWVRVKFGGEFVADSRNTLLVWDKHYIPTYFFPQDDVRMDLLEPSGKSRGQRTTYHIKVNGKTAENAAWSYTDPLSERTEVKDYVAFRWHKMDAWFEEEERIFVHARDPHKRVDVLSSSRHVQVKVNGQTLADTSTPYLLFETGLPTRYYIPRQDVRLDLLEPAAHETSCPYKGTASEYWSVKAGDKKLENVAWSYPTPIIDKIEGLICFFNEKVDLYVDGELQERPQTPWS